MSHQRVGSRCAHCVPSEIEELLHPSLIRPAVIPSQLAGVVPESDSEITRGPAKAANSSLTRNVSMQMAPETRARVIEDRLARSMQVPKAMHSLTKLFRVGPGPSSSHTMGPTPLLRGSRQGILTANTSRSLSTVLSLSLAVVT